jgi:hypothetical protein
MVRRVLTARTVLALTCVAALAAPAFTEELYAITTTSTLLRFDSTNPGAVTTIGAVTGITTGTLRSIDFRPATGELYGLSYDLNTDAAQLYRINGTTAAATPVGSAVTLSGTGGASRASLDFNPVVDLARVVTAGTTSTNYRLNPTTGALVAQDTNLAFAAGDPSTGAPYVASIAYSNNVPTASSTTLYGYDFARDVLVRIGSLGGSPVSPNTGQLFTIGNSGVSTTSDTIGLDIGPTGNAYLSGSVSGFNDSLMSVNLATGAATNLGLIGTGVDVMDIAVVAAIPEPTSLALGCLGVAGGAFALWRKRRRQAHQRK